ncbi:PP2C family protein-serine/threonine phosphatase [Streptomyces megasporus]|uniref:PP2C family protein-serine/threonine phosphatase n=1 Tax=Streptomyces megasporus TaxID=44060 RepID=UPI0004E17FB4|nr:PP2C family protein-serine/threonine phosphatase [Streptomyces megasporus]
MARDRTPPVGRRRWPAVLPVAVVLAAIVVDVLAPPETSTFPLLAAAPVLAAPVYSLAGTIATGVAALAAGAALTYASGGDLFSTARAVAFTSIVVLTVLAALLNRTMAHDRQRLKDAREVAEAVQRAVLPTPPRHIGPLDVAVRYRAAAKEAAIGGDLYAAHSTSHGTRLLIADVRGKGLEAVRTVNSLLGTFREATRLPDPADVVDRLEERAQEFKAEESGMESFATAVVVDVPADGGELRVVNLGHPAPLLLQQGRVRALEPATPALPLGLGDLGRPRVPIERHPLPPDAILLLFTDGVVEARDHNGAFYDPVPFLSRPLPADPDAVLDALLTDLDRHTDGRLDDDAALIAVTHRQSARQRRPNA